MANKMEHISFEAIDCVCCSYVPASNSWVCLKHNCDIKYVDTCIACRFDKIRRVEDSIRKKVQRGRVLLMAQDSLI